MSVSYGADYYRENAVCMCQKFRTFIWTKVKKKCAWSSERSNERNKKKSNYVRNSVKIFSFFKIYFVHLNVRNLRHIKNLLFLERFFYLKQWKINFRERKYDFFKYFLNFNLFYLWLIFCKFRSYERSELQLHAVCTVVHFMNRIKRRKALSSKLSQKGEVTQKKMRVHTFQSMILRSTSSTRNAYCTIIWLFPCAPVSHGNAPSSPPNIFLKKQSHSTYSDCLLCVYMYLCFIVRLFVPCVSECA